MLQIQHLVPKPEVLHSFYPIWANLQQILQRFCWNCQRTYWWQSRFQFHVIFHEILFHLYNSTSNSAIIRYFQFWNHTILISQLFCWRSNLFIEFWICYVCCCYPGDPFGLQFSDILAIFLWVLSVIWVQIDQNWSKPTIFEVFCSLCRKENMPAWLFVESPWCPP